MSDLPQDDLPPSTSPPSPDEPMTPRLLARLFVVPLLIVAMIVGSSVLVVLLFGWISTSQQESVEKLVARIEAGSGDKILGVALLPKDKEVWQAAMELAKRLEPGHPKGVTPEQKPGIAQRLEKILEQASGGEQHEEGQQMQQFMLTTLGSLGQPSSVDVLVKYATDSKQPPPVRSSAIGALVLMRTVPAAREVIPALIPLLEDPDAVVRVTTTVAIGALAKPEEPVAIAALGRAYRSSDRDMSWNAALALAKLGSGIALPLLQDMLTRKYWESQKVEVSGRQSPADADRRLTPVQIQNYLVVSIDAAVALHDDTLRPLIQKLTEDPSPQVRDRARKALQKWTPASKATDATNRSVPIATNVHEPYFAMDNKQRQLITSRSAELRVGVARIDQIRPLLGDPTYQRDYAPKEPFRAGNRGTQVAYYFTVYENGLVNELHDEYVRFYFDQNGILAAKELKQAGHTVLEDAAGARRLMSPSF